MFEEDFSKISKIVIYNNINTNHYHIIFELLKLFYFLTKKLKKNKKIDIFLKTKNLEMFKINHYIDLFNLKFKVNFKKNNDHINLGMLKDNIYYIIDNVLYIDGFEIRKTFKKDEYIKEYFLYIRKFPNFNNEKFKNKKFVINRKITRKFNSNTINEFKNLGYEEIFFEETSLFDQMNIFANSSEIVAVHGASLANLVFAHNDLKLTEIAIDFNNSCYPNLVDKLKLINIEINYKQIKTENKEGKNVNEIFFNIKDL
jgi:hypothetical protein